MTTPTALKRLERLIWVLIYGGLLTLVFGLAARDADPVLGHACIAIGAVVAAVGVVLIFVRARRHVDA